jgi:tetratricopeptide (TPR) repeat protein
VELDPGSAKGWFNLGVTLVKEGDYEGALAVYGHALALAPADPFVLSQTAFCLTMLKRYAVARDLYDRAIASDASYTDPLEGKAYLLWAMGEDE